MKFGFLENAEFGTKAKLRLPDVVIASKVDPGFSRSCSIDATSPGAQETFPSLFLFVMMGLGGPRLDKKKKEKKEETLAKLRFSKKGRVSN